MELKDAREAYKTNSLKAGDVARQASFAGIALIWIFKSQKEGVFVLHNDLLWPALFFVASLALDLLQYIGATLIWGYFHREKEKELGKDFKGDIAASKKLNWPAITFMWLKFVTVICGYAALLSYVLSVLKFT